MKIGHETFAAMRMHALDSYPDECCGVVVGTGAQAETVVRIRNIQDEMHAADPERYPRTARTAYVGDPADLKAALELAERPGGSLRVFYHSHPDHEAYFSEEDVRQATPLGEPSYPQALQIVISLDQNEVRDVKAFAWSDESSTYEPVEIEPIN